MVGSILRILLIRENKKREEAINKLAKIKLKILTTEERAEQLETMMGENWEVDPEWRNLPLGIRREFESENLIEHPDSKRYDEVLLVWLRDELRSVTNEHLMRDIGCESIEGEPVKFEACPCCGRRTIEERGHYDICRICWWEDDGQDNSDADIIMGGPNYEISLTQGRYNFLIHGIYDPKREDLIKLQEEKGKYVLEREFKIAEDGFIIEIGTEWKSKGFSPKKTD